MCYMNARIERGSDSENFGARITRNSVTLEKILAFQVLGGEMVISGGSRGIYGISRRLEGFCVEKNRGICVIWVKYKGLNANLEGLGLICN
jgi:hypothetical protein